MSDSCRFAYEPLLDLVDGRPAGVEVRRCLDRDRTEIVAHKVVWRARQLAEFDAGIAITSALDQPRYDATVPVHVDVAADTVVAARHRIAQLPETLRARTGGLPCPPIVLDIGPPIAAAPPDAFAREVAALRTAGFGIALDGVGSGFGIDLLTTIGPDLVKIEKGLVERLPTDPRARVVVSAVCAVASSCSATVSAVGVTHREELAALRDHGITRAQGPLLAALRSAPDVDGLVLPVDLMPRVRAARQPGAHRGGAGRAALPTVASLAGPAVELADDVTAEVVRSVFGAHPQIGSVLLTDSERRPTGFLDRNRFLLAVSGAYGHALYARRRAAALADPPRTVGTSTDVAAALEYCVSDRTRSWDDLVLLDGGLRCAGVVRVADLLQVVTGVQAGKRAGSVA